MNAKNIAVMRALGMAPAESTPDPDPTPAVPSFDGGARRTPPLEPESHGAWLTRVLRGQVMPGPPE
jgi:hypothetical protein